MTNTLEFLIELIGTRKAEAVLQNYVKKNWKGTDMQNFEAPTQGRKQHKRKFVLGAKRWTEDEKENLKSEVAGLREQGYTEHRIYRSLSESHHRTPSAIFNMVGKMKL